LFDPAWLRRSYPRCLWDGCRATPDTDFGRERCAEAYAEWEDAQIRWDEEHELIEEGETGDEDGDLSSELFCPS
jgi:hypothetical protein